MQIPDFLTLDQLLEKKESVLVVGGGFLGTELAVGMATRCKEREGRYTSSIYNGLFLRQEWRVKGVPGVP